MPLFVCDRCSSVENTACGEHIAALVDPSREQLCSACSGNPYRRFPPHAWHGLFERRVATPELKAAVGRRRFGEMPPGLDFKALPLFADGAPPLTGTGA